MLGKNCEKLNTYLEAPPRQFAKETDKQLVCRVENKQIIIPHLPYPLPDNHIPHVLEEQPDNRALRETVFAIYNKTGFVVKLIETDNPSEFYLDSQSNTMLKALLPHHSALQSTQARVNKSINDLIHHAHQIKYDAEHDIMPSLDKDKSLFALTRELQACFDLFFIHYMKTQSSPRTKMSKVPFITLNTKIKKCLKDHGKALDRHRGSKRLFCHLLVGSLCAIGLALGYSSLLIFGMLTWAMDYGYHAATGNEYLFFNTTQSRHITNQILNQAYEIGHYMEYQQPMAGQAIPGPKGF